MNRPFKRSLTFRRHQKGAFTMFSAVLILILLTEMVIYAVQTGVFEQRKSSNEVRQKQAFHIADSAIQQAKQFMLTNAKLVSSSQAQLIPKTWNNSGDVTEWESGWMTAGSSRWISCSGITDTSHPCFAESNATLRANSYYYSADGGTSFDLPLDPVALSSSPTSTEQVSVHALLCMLDIDRNADPIVQGCTTIADDQDERYFMVTLAARGEADCESASECRAEALIAEKIGSFGPGKGEGGPAVPLTARTAVPPSGTVELVPNPNGGGIGVPISTWANANDECVLDPPEDPVNPISGSWASCEAHEWYGQDTMPADYKCPIQNGEGNAGCRCQASEGDRMLSYAANGEQTLNIDVVIDDSFPCDLFEYMMGVSKVPDDDPATKDWTDLKASFSADKRLDTCDGLNMASNGPYWISGSSCTLSGQIGTPTAPVFLIISSATTTISSGAEIYGVVLVTNVEVADAQFTGNGHGTIYGAAVMDADMKNFNGTFQIVYVENLIGLATETGLFGAVQGGWTDFHASWQ